MNSENPRHGFERIGGKRSKLSNAIGGPKWRPRRRIAIWPGASRDEKRKGILLRMAEAEERHAQRWEKNCEDLGAEPPVLKDTIGRRLNRWWNKVAGAEIAIRRMEATEERQEAEFHEQARARVRRRTGRAGISAKKRARGKSACASA